MPSNDFLKIAGGRNAVSMRYCAPDKTLKKRLKLSSVAGTILSNTIFPEKST
jgi:hypothetical protein